MTEYKNIAAAWLNDSKKGKGKYLSIKNTGTEPIIIEPGQNFFMNMTPKEIREKHEGVPMFSKSVKVENKVEDQEVQAEDVADDIPF